MHDALMHADGHHVFETPVGRCAIAWSELGIAGVLLPRADGSEPTEVLRRWGTTESTPPAAVQDAVDRIGAVLQGAADDLLDVALDLRGVAPFECRVYEAARAVPPGRTATYGEIAVRIGEPGAARAVGVALGRNPFPIVVPCHRVLAAGGRTGGFSAPGGVATKLKLLAIEGTTGHAEPDLFAR